MVLAKVPLTPQWNLTNGCVCTPDGGFLYVGSRSINYVGPIQQVDGADGIKEPPEIKVFHTRQSILSIDIDPGWPGSVIKAADNATEVANTHNNAKYFAALAQDNSVQIWNFDLGCAMSGHKAHFSTALYMEGNGPSPQGDHVLLSYMRNRNVLSINAQDIVVYCVASNTYCRRPMFISSRNQTLTVLRCSPYNEHIFAVGTNRGLVVIGDLQSMSTLYMLRGHETAITSLSWRPLDIEPFKQQNTAQIDEAHTEVKNDVQKVSTEEPQQLTEDAKQTKTAPKQNAKTQKNSKKSIMPVGNDDIFDIYDYDYLDNEFGAPTETEKKFKETAEEFVVDKSMECGPTTEFDFVEACNSLKGEIDALKQEQDYGDGDAKQLPDVTLADCQKVACADDLSSSCGDDNSGESTEGSLDLAERCSSDDEVCVDGGDLNKKQQILHQAEVHAEQSNDLEKKEIKEKSEVLTTKPVADDNIDKNSTKTSVEVKVEDKRTVSESNSEQPSIDGVASQANSYTAEKKAAQQPTLLASASIDGNFWIWNTNTGASCDRMRAISTGKHGKNTSIHIDWLSSTEFLTTNKTGELTLWYMVQTNPTETINTHQRQRYKFKADTKKSFQQRSVMSFSISHANNLLWCLSSYREISCEHLQSEKLLLKYCCSSTNVSAMRECPDDMNKIALAFSDRRVGIIDISKMSATNVFIENFVSRVDASVLALVWSPDSKRLAFGTLEGRVGVINVESGKPTTTFHPFCGKPIYSIDWQGDHIFVVCNDILAVYETNSEQKDAHIIREVKSISTVSIHDGILYVGTQRGHVQVYKRNPNVAYCYSLVQDVPLAPRYITEISWSPIANDHVAVVANANNIHILKAQSTDGVLTPVRRIEIKNPKAANACVKWSNRNANEFLTCGFDGGVRVWDLNSTKNVEKFLKFFPCPMICGLLLPTDEQIVMCAGKSTSVELFDMRLEESEMYSSIKWKRTNTLDQVKWAMKVAPRTEVTKPSTATERRRAKRALVGGPAENSATAECANGAAAGNGEAGAEVADLLGSLKLNEKREEKSATALVKEEVKASKEMQVAKANEMHLDWTNGSIYMRTPSTVMNLTTKELNKDVLEKLNMVLSNRDTKPLLLAKLFGTKADAQRLLDVELNTHRTTKSAGVANLFMTQVKSSLKDEILIAIQTKELCEWHVALAPTISYSFWQHVCQVFAEQLLEQGYALLAATYIIALHRHEVAIEMLMSKYYFKEALLIGRIHLQKDDPLLLTIVDKWTSHLVLAGNLTGSALLSTLSGQYNRAHDTLSRIRNSYPEIERVLEMLNKKMNAKQ
ncbi:protein rigor mortis [Zeugodacus cucurbitae]|uniref:protein rigor mortis n=1 Tax=Zeugodacus cucurbitae TaxID=28588 RepID=UPI0023D92016|nr:protein rigor mortis [Zeugodacus cucurbitae]